MQYRKYGGDRRTGNHCRCSGKQFHLGPFDFIQRFIRFSLLFALVLSLSACIPFWDSDYSIQYAWTDGDSLYIVYKKTTDWGAGNVINVHGGLTGEFSTSHGIKLDKSKIRNGDVIDLSQATPVDDDLIYKDPDFEVERNRPPHQSDNSKATITTNGVKSTVLCKGRDTGVPIRLKDKLLFCNYAIPVGGYAAAVPALFEYRLEPGAFNDGSLYFYHTQVKTENEHWKKPGEPFYIEEEGPLRLTKMDADTFKVSETVVLPFQYEQFHKFPSYGYFRHGFIIERKENDNGIVYACVAKKCRKFDLKVKYADGSSAIVVEDSGDTLLRFSSQNTGRPKYKVSFVKAEPE